MIFAKKRIAENKKDNYRKPFKKTNSLILISSFLASFLVLTLILSNISPAVLAKPEAEAATDNSDKQTLEVVEIDSEINSLNKRISSLRSEAASLEGEISSTEEEVQSSRSDLANRKKRLNARAREIYINGQTDTAVTFITSDDFSDFMTKRDYTERIVANDSRLIKEVKKKSEELDGLLASLKQKEKESKVTLNDLEARRDDLEKSKNERNAMLAAAGPNRSEVVQQSGQAESRIAAINPSDSTPPPAGKDFVMIATAYSPEEPGLSDSTATGLKAQKGVVAVDPSFIPLGTRVYVDGYGYAVAADTGSAIKGNRIDLCYDTLSEALSFGIRSVRVRVLD